MLSFIFIKFAPTKYNESETNTTLLIVFYAKSGRVSLYEILTVEKSALAIKNLRLELS